MNKYAIVIEHGENNLSAYVPDLPGCITTGRTNMREAIEIHLDGLREDGEPTGPATIASNLRSPS